MYQMISLEIYQVRTHSSVLAGGVMEALLWSTNKAASYSFAPGWTVVISSFVSNTASLATPLLVLMAELPIAGMLNVTVCKGRDSNSKCLNRQYKRLHCTA